MGLLLSAFLWAYAAFQLPAGALVDRIGPAQAFGAGIFIWSLAQAWEGWSAGSGNSPERGCFSAWANAQFSGLCSRARLVQRSRARIADRDRALRLEARPSDSTAVTDGVDAGVWMALDVRHHGRRRDRCRDLVVPGLSRAARGGADSRTKNFTSPMAKRNKSPTGSPGRTGNNCSPIARPGAWCSGFFGAVYMGWVY